MANGSAPRNRPALGRGLSSLIVNTDHTPDIPEISLTKDAPQAPAGERMIPVKMITPNPHQPRRQFKPEQIAELADSIKQQGVLQPLLVAPSNNNGQEGFLLIAGERRLRAATQAGLTEVPCVVRDATPQQITEWAMIENIQREDLNAVELAEAYRDLMDRFNFTQAQVAEKLSVPRGTVANYLRVLDLEDSVQSMLVEGSLTFGHAKVLAGLAGHADRQRSFAKRVVEQGFTVRQLEGVIEAEDLARQGVPVEADAGETKKTDGRKKDVDPHIRDLQDQLTRHLGVKVRIKPGRAANAGRLVIDYYSLGDFDRLLEQLGATLES